MNATGSGSSWFPPNTFRLLGSNQSDFVSSFVLGDFSHPRDNTFRGNNYFREYDLISTGGQSFQYLRLLITSMEGGEGYRHPGIVETKWQGVITRG